LASRGDTATGDELVLLGTVTAGGQTGT